MLFDRDPDNVGQYLPVDGQAYSVCRDLAGPVSETLLKLLSDIFDVEVMPEVIAVDNGRPIYNGERKEVKP